MSSFRKYEPKKKFLIKFYVQESLNSSKIQLKLLVVKMENLDNDARILLLSFRKYKTQEKFFNLIFQSRRIFISLFGKQTFFK